MSQLSFDWPDRVSLQAEDYFVSDSNRAAFAMTRDPAAWPLGKLVLIGPEASGKSHLARVFAAAHGATILAADHITADTLRPDGATVIEDADRLPSGAEEWLFHHHNALAGRAPLLITARDAPTRWGTALADLRSRMEGTSVVRIEAPDEAMLMAVMMKLFADRQIAPEPELIPYLITRLDRSFAHARDAVSALDRLALAHGRPVGRRLASDWLAGRI